MNKELKITKEDLVNWIDRPPSNDDLDLCEYLSNAVQNREKYFEKIKQLQNNWNELKKLIDERIGDCRYFLTNADVNYEKENMKKFMWLKEELQVLKSKVQELEQGKDE